MTSFFTLNKHIWIRVCYSQKKKKTLDACLSLLRAAVVSEGKRKKKSRDIPERFRHLEKMIMRGRICRGVRSAITRML